MKWKNNFLNLSILIVFIVLLIRRIRKEEQEVIIVDEECDKNIKGVLYASKKHKKGKFAYFSILCSDEEILQALVLAQSWKDSKSNYPLIFMVLPYVEHIDKLEQIGAKTIRIGSINTDFVRMSTGKRPSFQKACKYSKIHLWKFTEYKKIAFVDTQMLFVSNSDDVFFFDGFSAVKTAGNHFNTSFFVTSPNKKQFEQMLIELKDSPPTALGEQGFINWFYETHKELKTSLLSVIYNVKIINKNYAVWNVVKEHAKLLHYPHEFSPWNLATQKNKHWNLNFEHFSFLKWENKRAYVKSLFHKKESGEDKPFFTKQRRDALCKDPQKYDSKRFIISTHFTVIIGTWGEKRISLLRQLVLHYQRCKSVHKIYVVWHNPATKPPKKFLSTIRKTPPVEFLSQEYDSLNNRFNPIFSLETKAVLICDDDVRVSTNDIEFSFNVWKNRQDSLVGCFPRTHSKNKDGSYNYETHSKQNPKTYSIILTKFMFMRSEYLYIYTCLFSSEILDYIDQVKNCEDIAMNILVTGMTGASPVSVLIQSDDFGTFQGISTNQGHQNERSKCLSKFLNIFNEDLLQQTREVFCPWRNSLQQNI